VIGLLSSFAGGSEISNYFMQGLLSTGARLDMLGITSLIVRDTPSVVPYQGGWSLGYIPISFIPRILWEGKPEFRIGGWVTANYGGGPHIISSTGPGWIGELYFNFGLAGVIIGMLFIGTLFRTLHETLFRADATIPALLACVVVLWTTCPTMEGTLLTPISGGIFRLTPILLTHLLIRITVGTTTTAAHRARGPTPGAT
jgi:hypothetical protein